jgi:hypothetical protein
MDLVIHDYYNPNNDYSIIARDEETARRFLTYEVWDTLYTECSFCGDPFGGLNILKEAHLNDRLTLIPRIQIITYDSPGRFQMRLFLVNECRYETYDNSLFYQPWSKKI